MAEFDTPTASPDAPTATAPLSLDERSRKSAFRIVFLVVFIDLLGFGIVLPLLPLYVFRLLKPVLGEQTGLIGPVLGVLMASFSFMQFIFAPIWGRISDRIGRRPVLIIGLAGSVVFYGLFGYASHIGFEGRPELALWLILISRIGAGLAGATISTAQAVIADCTPAHKRSHGMAMIGVAFGIGFTFGPLLAWTSELVPTNAAPGAAAAGLSLIALILAVVLLPETLRAGTSAGQRRWIHFGYTIKVLQMPTIGILVLTFFLATLAFGSLESTLALMNQYLLTGGEKVVRLEEMTEADFKDVIQKSLLIFAFVGLVLMLDQGLIYRRMVTRVGERRMLRSGIALMLVGLAAVVALILSVAHQSLIGMGSIIPPALGILAVLVTGFAFMTPSVSSLISKSAPPDRQGEILGVNQSMSALARILGPAAASSLFFVDDTHVWPYAVGMGLMATVLVITLRLQDPAPAA